VIVCTVQVDEVPGADGEFEVGQNRAAVSELFGPRPGDRGDGAGGDDPVERRVLGQPSGAVGSHQGGPETRRGQPGAGQVDKAGVHFDGEHPLIAESMSEQGGVVAGAGADLQDAVSVLSLLSRRVSASRRA
jgi:hypothetical protein